MSMVEESVETRWTELVHYVSDLVSLLDDPEIEVEVEDYIGIYLDGASVRVRPLSGYGWTIGYTSMEITINVNKGIAEYWDGRIRMRGFDAEVCRNAGKALALIVGLLTAYTLRSAEAFFRRFFRDVMVGILEGEQG